MTGAFYLCLLLGTLEVTATPQDTSKNPPGGGQAIPSEPGVYYDAGGEFKRLPLEFIDEDKMVVFRNQPPPLVIVYSKDGVHIGGLRLIPASGFSLTIGTSGSGAWSSRWIAPPKTEPIAGRSDAFRVIFDSLSPDTYMVISQFVDKKDGKEKITMHAGFLLK